MHSLSFLDFCPSYNPPSNYRSLTHSKNVGASVAMRKIHERSKALPLIEIMEVEELSLAYQSTVATSTGPSLDLIPRSPSIRSVSAIGFNTHPANLSAAKLRQPSITLSIKHLLLKI